MNDYYSAPWAERYSSENMLQNFSNNTKYQTWRKLWTALAEAQMESGLPISPEQINEMRTHQDDIDYELVKHYENIFHHDVMAHIHAYGDAAPSAKGIIHMGATSAFVTDNTDIIQMRDGLYTIRIGLVRTIEALAVFALRYKDLPALGFTHFQPAQLTTVGKRATLWIQSLLSDLRELEFILDGLALRGIKGAVGTGSGFADLFDGDYQKFKKLDMLVAQKMGFSKTVPVSGQTYDRKTDSKIVNLLGNIAESAHKFTNDLRLLQHLREVEEPFAETQIGSSAMAYKRNPILSERISSLAKFVLSLVSSPAMVASTQWLERSLDDSANKRLTIPQAFLGTDAILILFQKIATGLTVYPQMIKKHIDTELPFIATEALLMHAVKKGGDRQALHETLRKHSMKAAANVKEAGLENNLLKQLANDPDFPLSCQEIGEIVNAKNFTGYASEQTEDFFNNEVAPYLKKYDFLLNRD